MKKSSFYTFLPTAALGAIASVSAQMITPAATGSGSQVNNFSLISNGVIPSEGAALPASSNVWWVGYGTSITLDLGFNYRVNDLLASVDNNDRYQIDYSLDGFSFTHLFTILPSYGEIAASPDGLDTLSTDDTSPDYILQIDFPPVLARYLRIRATPGGDALNAVSELRAFGSPVPEPSSYGLIGAAGHSALVVLRPRRENVME